MYKKNNKYKLGFTLVELMIFFVVFSAILAATMPVITKHTQKLPVKTSHGTYICTRDENGYREKIVTTSGQIIDNSVDRCHFTPPANASLFKIELIGAGVGGKEFADVVDTNNEYQGQYHIKQQTDPQDIAKYTGDEIVKLTPKQLKYILNNKYFKISQFTGNATESYIQNDILKTVPDIYSDELSQLTLDDKNKLLDKWEEDKKLMENLSRITKTSSHYPQYSGDSKYLYDVRRNTEVTQYKEEYEDILQSRANIEYISGYIYNKTQNENKIQLDGGKGCYLIYTDYINLDNISDEEIEDYIANLFTKKYTSGYTNDPQTCSSFKTSEEDIIKKQKAYDRKYFDQFKKDIKNIIGEAPDDNTIIYQENIASIEQSPTMIKVGEDVTSYGGIKIDDKCYTNKEKAKAFPVPMFYHYKKSPQNIGNTLNYKYVLITPSQKLIKYFNSPRIAIGAVDARDVTPSNPKIYVERYYKKEGKNYKEREENSMLSSIPENINIKAKVNSRTHYVGSGGKAGEYKVFYAPSLQDDCSFIVHPGGPVRIDYDGTNKPTPQEYYDALNTTVSCNDNGLKYIARGGNSYTTKINKLTLNEDDRTAQKEDDEILQYDYQIIRYINFETGEPNLEKFVTYSLGEDSPVKNYTIFSRRNNLLNNDINITEYGKGGNGSEIEDKCVKPAGEYETQLTYTNGHEENAIKYQWKKDACEWKVKDAQKGNAGAVIISW